MIQNNVKLTAACGILGAAILANGAVAMTHAECGQLPGNMFLAAIERGECEIDDIQTAAGPQEDPGLIPDDSTRNRDGRNGGGNDGGGNDDGGDGGGSRSTAGNR